MLRQLVVAHSGSLTRAHFHKGDWVSRMEAVIPTEIGVSSIEELSTARPCCQCSLSEVRARPHT
jgi:hypothetical protein